MNKIIKDPAQVPSLTQPLVDYGRLRNALKVMLELHYRGGDRIPSERKLAAEFKVSPATISRTLQNLAQSGVVRRVRGSGTYLCDRTEQPAASMPARGDGSLSHSEILPFGSGNNASQIRQHPELSTALSGRTIGIVAEIGDVPARPGEPEGVGHRVVSAIERQVQSYGGSTRIIDAQRHADGTESAMIGEMLKKGTDSIVLIDYGLQTDRWLAPLLEARRTMPGSLPLVLAMISDVCEWPVDCIRIDDAWGVFDAVNHLLRQGHRRLGFLSPAKGFYSWADARAAAFHRAITLWNSVNETAASGTVLYAPDSYFSQTSVSHWIPISQALADEFVHHPELTGVVAANDNMALLFVSAIEAKGIRVPEGVSVIGYDNIMQAASANLCTLDLPAEQLGIQVAKLCRQRMENPIWDMRIEIALKPILLLRGSVQPPAKQAI